MDSGGGKPRISRKAQIVWIAATINTLLLLFALPALLQSLPRSWSGVRIIETLKNPFQVNGWKREGLILADGRLLPLPGLTRLPETSQSLAEAIKSGVEVDQSGRVVGLLRIHHWCGNDRAYKHVARIDLADLLLYFKEGESQLALPEEIEFLREPGTTFQFTEQGWNVSQFFGYTSWRSGLTR
jgi:hypothetical protein